MMNEYWLREFLDHSEKAVARYKIVYDENEEACDFIFLDLNTSFEALIGIEKSEILNKKATDVFNSRLHDHFDWVSFIVDIAQTDSREAIEVYSKTLRKWLRFDAFSNENGYLTVSIKDITSEKQTLKQEKDILSYSSVLLEMNKVSIDYQLIVEKIKSLTGAAASVLNLAQHDSGIFKTMAVSGSEDETNELFHLIGFNPFEKKWRLDSEKLNVDKTGKIIAFENMMQLLNTIVPDSAIQEIEKKFNLGQIYLVKIMKKEILQGNFVLLFDKGNQLINEKETIIFADMTGLVLEEQKSRNRYKMLFEQSSDGLFVHDTDGWIKDVNRTACRMLGYDIQGLIGRNVKDLSPDVEMEDVKQAFEVIKSEKSSYLETTLIKKDKSWIQVSIKSTMFDPEKELILGMVRDITQKKQREIELRKLYTAVQQGPALVAITDLKGNIEYVNWKFQEMTGYAFEEVQGQNPRLLKSGEHSEAFYEELWQTITSANEWEGEIHNKKKNGELYWENASISPVLNKQSKIVKYVKVAQDITEHKKAEQTLSENRNVLNTIINNVPGYLHVVNREQRIVIANKNWLSTAKNKFDRPEEVNDKLCYKVFMNRDEPCEGCRIKEVFEIGEGIAVTSPPKHPIEQVTGKSLKVLTAPIKGKNDDFIGVVEYAFDITELKEARIKAQEASKAKSNFLASMSHEIRTPLNGVIGFADMLRKTEMNELQTHYLENVNNSANALLDIINDILDFSKIESGKMALNPEPANIIELLENTLKVIKPKAEERNIELSLTKSERIPRFVKIDSVRLRQIATNLLSNAVKFTENGEIELKAELNSINEETGKANINFSVRDTGIGISKKAQKKIFESFSQADPSTTKRFGGTGLGLNITNKLLEMMGSRLELESEEGKGSLFRFTLELEKTETVETERTVNEDKNRQLDQTEQKISMASGEPIKVLIAEDNELNMELTEIIVNDMVDNAVIIKANNGREAIKQHKTHSPDIILMDVQMPEMSGYEATKQIRASYDEKNQSTFIIALTAATVKGEKEKALKAGMDEYLTKPLAVQALKQALLKNNHLRSKNQIPAEEKVLQHFHKAFLHKILKNKQPVIDRIMKTGKKSLYESEKALKDSFEKQDQESIKTQAHKLKGIASNLRFEILQKLSGELEEAAANQTEFSAMKKLYSEIEKEIVILKQLI